MTRGEFGQQMARLGAAFRKTINQATAQVYFEALEGLAPLDLAGAVTWAIKHSTFLPTPAEILARGQYERTARLRALPPADVPALPEWVTGPEADVPALMAALMPTLTAASRRLEAVRPSSPAHEPAPMSADDRVSRAHSELARYRAYLTREPA